MSIHAELTEEAIEALRKQRRNTVASAWTVSILTFVLLAVILVTARIYVFNEPETPPVAVYNLPTTTMPPSDEITPPEEVQEQPVTTTPMVAITSNAVTASIIPAVSEGDPSEIPGVSTIDLGLNMGDMPVVVAGPSGGGMFGRTQPGGSAFVGAFYDTKLLANAKPSGLKVNEFLDLVHEFVTKGWKEQAFSRYYKSPTKLYLSHFYIPEIPATEAPKAFKCPPQVKDQRWVAIYRGTVTAPISGKFRFVGYGDDCIVVRFNGENVFDYGWYQMGVKGNTASGKWKDYMSTGKGGTPEMRKAIRDMGVNIPPVTFFPYSTIPHINRYLGGAVGGKIFEVKKDHTYQMEVLVTEIPGGKFSMALLIQNMKEGTYVEKDKKTGLPILDLFRTDFSLPSVGGESMESAQKARSIPYLEASMAWPTTLPKT